MSVKVNLMKRLDKIEQESSLDTEGCINEDPMKIVLKKDASLYCVTTARRVLFPILPKVKDELNRQENEGIIEKVTESTNCCVAILPVIKRNEKV